MYQNFNITDIDCVYILYYPADSFYLNIYIFSDTKRVLFIVFNFYNSNAGVERAILI